MLTESTDATMTQRAEAQDNFAALALAQHLQFTSTNTIPLGLEYQPGSGHYDIIEGCLVFADGQWDLLIELTDDAEAQSCWDEGIIASSKHSICLPAHCWSPELVSESVARWFVMAFPEHHLPEISLAMTWTEPDESHQRFLAQKRADSENRRLLG